MADLKLHHSH